MKVGRIVLKSILLFGIITKSLAAEYTGYSLPFIYNNTTYGDILVEYLPTIGITRTYYFNPLDTSYGICAGKLYFSEFSVYYGGHVDRLWREYYADGSYAFNQQTSNTTISSIGNYNDSGYLSYTFNTSRWHASLPIYADDCVTVIKESELVSYNTIPNTPLEFPLYPSTGYTPWTAPVSSVMDQSTLGNGATYGSGADGEVVTFEGEVGDVGPHAGSTCYRKSDNTAFGTSFNYVGTSDTGGSYYLCYDAHPGYDYPRPLGTAIFAPANGTLCIEPISKFFGTIHSVNKTKLRYGHYQ